MTLAQHSSQTNEHPTPKIVNRCTWRVFGGPPDLDPASRADHNSEGVQATNFFKFPKASKLLEGDTGGLGAEWFGKVFCNPPGGSLTPIREDRIVKSGKNKGLTIKADSPGVIAYKAAVKAAWGTNSHAVAWWRKGLHEVLEGRAEELIFLAFSIEIFQSAQSKDWISPLRFPFCVPSKRLQFGGAAQPTHANAIIYVGHPEGEARFCEHFARVGEVRP